MARKDMEYKLVSISANSILKSLVPPEEDYTYLKKISWITLKIHTTIVIVKQITTAVRKK